MREEAHGSSAPVELRSTRRSGRDLPVLVVDGEVVPYGRLFDGTYFLQENAYEWGDDLRALGARLARRRADARLRAHRPSGG